MNNNQLKIELKKNLKILKLWRNEEMIDFNQCEICKEIKIDDICDYQEFTNGDELPICNDCIKEMIENEEIFECDNVLYEFTKKGLEERLKQIKKELDALERYERRYLLELKGD